MVEEPNQGQDEATPVLVRGERLPRATKLRLGLLAEFHRMAGRYPRLYQFADSRLGRSMRGRLIPPRLDEAFADETKPVEFRVNGVTLVAPAHFIKVYIQREYEPMLVEWIRNHVKPGATVIDVGAHIGFLSVVLSRAVGPSGHVIALEPAQENIRYLRTNLQRNRARNVRVEVLAADSHTGKRPFNITGSTDSHGFYDHPLTPTMSVIEVETISLDELLTSPVELIKIDVEGAELDVLEGMTQTLAAGSPDKLVVEWTPACQIRAGHRIDELPKRIRELGFTLTVFDDIEHRVRSVDEVIALWNAHKLSEGWYANLVCAR
jgi:FkbM family methyltransferase